MTNNDDIKTFDHCKLSPSKLLENWKYQKDLTEKLDDYKGMVDQDWINQVILWKVNRYAQLSEEGIKALNEIPTSQEAKRDDELTRRVLGHLLSASGIRLPAASTILRFRNPHIYQIIDQRAYRVITGTTFKLTKNNDEMIDLYIGYLNQLEELAKQPDFDFHYADRILYQADIHLKNPKLIY